MEEQTQSSQSLHPRTRFCSEGEVNATAWNGFSKSTKATSAVLGLRVEARGPVVGEKRRSPSTKFLLSNVRSPYGYDDRDWIDRPEEMEKRTRRFVFLDTLTSRELFTRLPRWDIDYLLPLDIVKMNENVYLQLKKLYQSFWTLILIDRTFRSFLLFSFNGNFALEELCSFYKAAEIRLSHSLLRSEKRALNTRFQTCSSFSTYHPSSLNLPSRLPLSQHQQNLFRT
jgi:hypothetical protein